MTPNELERWQIFQRLIAFFSEGNLWLKECSPAFEWIAQLTGARAICLSLEQDGKTRRKVWGDLPPDGAPWPGWEIHRPLFGASEPGSDEDAACSHCLRILGDNDQAPPANLLIAQMLVSVIDAGLANEKKIHDERSRRLLKESLLEISQALNSTLEMEELLTLIMDCLAGLVPYDSATVMLLEDGLLIMHAARGYENLSGPVDLSSITFVPANTYLMNEVLHGDQPVILSDAQDVPDWLWAPCGKHVRSWLGVPLKVRDQVIGVFSLDKAVPNFFTAQHAELAEALSAHAALALENARMFAQIRETQKQLEGLSAQVIEAQEQERRKIALELHDHTGQALLGLRAELQVLKHHLAADPPKALEQIEYLDEIVRELSQELRQLAHDLRPPMLYEMGLAPVLEQYIDEFSRRMGIPVNFEFRHEREIARLPEKVEIICYRIVQEALTNLAKHAQANKVKVTLDLSYAQVKIEVIDDGIGFSPHLNRAIEGFGLIGIRERVTSVGGSLQIFSQPGWGTRLTVEIPALMEQAYE